MAAGSPRRMARSKSLAWCFSCSRLGRTGKMPGGKALGCSLTSAHDGPPFKSRPCPPHRAKRRFVTNPVFETARWTRVLSAEGWRPARRGGVYSMWEVVFDRPTEHGKHGPLYVAQAKSECSSEARVLAKIAVKAALCRLALDGRPPTIRFNFSMRDSQPQQARSVVSTMTPGSQWVRTLKAWVH
jgi:hypothetical protein